MKIELKLAIHSEPQNAAWLAYERWANKLGEMSGGRIKVTVVDSGFAGIEEWDMLKSSQSDMGRIFTLNMEPFPMHTVPALPFLMPAGQGNLSIVNSLYDSFLYREWQEVKVLWLGLMSPYHLHTSQKPVRTLEDFQGLRIRALGLVAELVKAWGGIPTEITAAAGGFGRKSVGAAVYSALETGMVDGTISTFEVTKDFKLYEVTRHHTYLNVIRDVNATVMNLEAWDSLPPDIQKVFEEISPWAQQELNAAQIAEADEARAILEQRGHTMIELQPEEYSRWVNTAGTVTEETLTKLDAAGVPATAIAEEIHRLAAGL